MLEPPSRARERILLIGPWGAGKSTAWATIYDWLRRTESPGKLYLIDTDRAVDRVCPSLPESQFADVHEWPEYLTAIDRFIELATRDDWLVIDLIDKAWSAVQNHFIHEAFGKNAASYFMEWKKGDSKAGNALADGFGANWQVINKMYDEFMQEKVLRWPGHILACSPADPVKLPDRKGEGGDEKEILDAFGRYGVKPAGQKKLGFQFLSVILLNPKANETWAFSSMKDVKRERPQNQPLTDFVMDYLVGVAKWTL
jgi:hypothetical protein